MDEKNRRLKVMTEILAGIKVLNTFIRDSFVYSQFINGYDEAGAAMIGIQANI